MGSEVKKNVDLRQFSVGGGEYGRGLARFNNGWGSPLPVLLQEEADLGLAGWGCGIFMIKNLMVLFGVRPTTEYLLEVVLNLGAHRGGTDGEAVQRIFRYFGFRVGEREIEGIEQMREITDSGGVVATTIIAGDWDKMHAGRLQTFDSHWVVIPAVDERQLVVMDSDIRGEGPGTPTFGVYTMPGDAFMMRNYDFEHVGEGGFVSPSEDFVWGESRWHHRHILEVRR